MDEYFELLQKQEPLNSNLAEHLGQMSRFQALRHPLIYMVPYHEMHNAVLNRQYAYKLESLAKAEADHDWSTYVFLHERPYRLDALTYVLDEIGIPDKEKWPLLINVWTDSENINQNLNEWINAWTAGLNDGNVCHLGMDKAEVAALAALPNRFTIYRGVGHEDAIDGLSWTTDRKKAEWFAKRWSHADDHESIVAIGKVDKADVLAHLRGRGESEIVVLPDNVKITKIERIRK